VKITQEDVVSIPLDRPRTVCTDPRCKKVIMVNGVTTVNYTNYCHRDCFVEGIPENLIGSEKLKKCAAMDNTDYCVGGVTDETRACGHHLSLHTHVLYELRVTRREVVDSRVEELMRERADRMSVLKEAIDKIDVLIARLKKEQKQIIAISAGLAHYTKRNAIVVFNDDLDAYLDMLIREEKAKRQAGANNQSVVDGLEQVKDNYQAQKVMFDEALSTSPDADRVPKSIEDVREHVKQLYRLPEIGGKLKGIIDRLHQIKEETALKLRELSSSRT